jgi:hypothetical protein
MRDTSLYLSDEPEINALIHELTSIGRRMKNREVSLIKPKRC